MRTSPSGWPTGRGSCSSSIHGGGPSPSIAPLSRRARSPRATCWTARTSCPAGRCACETSSCTNWLTDPHVRARPMKAIVVHEVGGPEALRLADVAAPTPGPEQVLVRVAAAGVNYADVLLRAGQYDATAPPFVPGIEAAGTLEAGGSGVAGYAPGAPVCGWGRRRHPQL